MAADSDRWYSSSTTSAQQPTANVVRGAGAAQEKVLGSVGKASAILTSFTAESRTMGVSELARSAGIPKSTAHRLLGVLVDWGLVARTGTVYSPGPGLTELASLTGSARHQRLRDVALPHLLDLYEKTHETVHLAVLDGEHILYVEKIFGHDRVKSPSRVGGRVPAACSALGKALLAFSDAETVELACRRLRPVTPNTIVSPRLFIKELQMVQNQGVAFDRDEASPGLTCVAAPIMSRDGRGVAAVSVSGPSKRFRPTSTAAVVRHAAAGIGREVQAITDHRETTLHTA